MFTVSFPSANVPVVKHTRGVMSMSMRYVLVGETEGLMLVRTTVVDHCPVPSLKVDAGS